MLNEAKNKFEAFFHLPDRMEPSGPSCVRYYQKTIDYFCIIAPVLVSAKGESGC